MIADIRNTAEENISVFYLMSHGFLVHKPFHARLQITHAKAFVPFYFNNLKNAEFVVKQTSIERHLFISQPQRII